MFVDILDTLRCNVALVWGSTLLKILKLRVMCGVCVYILLPCHSKCVEARGCTEELVSSSPSGFWDPA